VPAARRGGPAARDGPADDSRRISKTRFYGN
jgi:hypothetical protein